MATPTTDKQLSSWPITRLKPDPTQPRREFDPSSLEELANNMARNGQISPIIAYVDPAASDTLIVVDGERRLRAAQRIPLETMDGIILPGPPGATELLLDQLSVNHFREALSVRDQGAAFRKLISDLGLTQAELATRLGISESQVSKVLSRDRIAPELLPLADSLEASVVPLIARLSPSEQHETMAFATTVNELGKRPTRDQVQAFVSQRKPKPPSARAKTFTGKVEERQFRIALKPDDTHEALIESLNALINLVRKNRHIPVVNLNVLFGN